MTNAKGKSKTNAIRAIQGFFNIILYLPIIKGMEQSANLKFLKLFVYFTFLLLVSSFQIDFYVIADIYMRTKKTKKQKSINSFSKAKITQNFILFNIFTLANQKGIKWPLFKQNESERKKIEKRNISTYIGLLCLLNQSKIFFIIFHY